MKLFSYWAQPNVIHNAAPVTHSPFVEATRPVVRANPFAVLTGDVPTFRVLDRDALTLSTPQSERKPLIPSFKDSLDWLSTHNEADVRDRLDSHLAGGTHEDLRQVVGLLNAALKGQKLDFKTDEARQEAIRQYKQAVEALMTNEPTAKTHLQRVLREVQGFRNLGGAKHGDADQSAQPSGASCFALRSLPAIKPSAVNRFKTGL